MTTRVLTFTGSKTESVWFIHRSSQFTMKKTHKDNIMFKYGNAYINLSVHFLWANNLETEQEQDNPIDKDIKISSYNKPTQL
jgi:hypothetical protein